MILKCLCIPIGFLKACKQPRPIKEHIFSFCIQLNFIEIVSVTNFNQLYWSLTMGLPYKCISMDFLTSGVDAAHEENSIASRAKCSYRTHRNRTLIQIYPCFKQIFQDALHKNKDSIKKCFSVIISLINKSINS